MSVDSKAVSFFFFFSFCQDSSRGGMAFRLLSIKCRRGHNRLWSGKPDVPFALGTAAV